MTTRQQVKIADRGLGTSSNPLALGRFDGLEQGANIHTTDFITAIKYASSNLIIYRSAQARYKLGVDIAQIRRERLREHAKSIGGPAKLAEKLDRSNSQISQIIGKKPTRNIGRQQARRIEKILGLEDYWLDGTATTAPRSVREELIAELVHELTPEQQAELLPALRATVDANRTTQGMLSSKLKTIGNTRVEETLGLPSSTPEKQ